MSGREGVAIEDEDLIRDGDETFSDDNHAIQARCPGTVETYTLFAYNNTRVECAIA